MGENMKNLVYGVGVKDADYTVAPVINGVQQFCKIYMTWRAMLKRCYLKSYQLKRPTYINCYVDDDWLLFSKFKDWMIAQKWEGYQLDKDLLFQGNKIYSEKTCIFVPLKVNSLLNDCRARRGEYPLGVTLYKSNGKFMSQIKINGSRVHLGYFFNPMDAHIAWQFSKSNYINLVANEQSDERIKNSLLLRVEQINNDIKNGIETIKL